MQSTSSNSFTPSQLSGKEDDPVFSAPWEAKAFAIVNQLAAEKAYSWSEWTDKLSAEITVAESSVENESTYYERWVAACEKLLVAKGILNSQDIDCKVAEIVTASEAKQHKDDA